MFGILLFFMLVYFPLYAEKVQSVKTKYFEIIYAETSAPSAALLTEYADGFADEICTALHQQIKKRIPVYLVPDTEDLNGYFTRSPYPRIVIYDAGITDGQLGNLTDTLLRVFYHELTHALTLNVPFSLFNLLPMSFTEGVAVSFESLSGQGRLHDPLIKQYLIQNKIDGTAPTWREAAGTRDMYPGGLWPYIYGGYFSDYLQKTYGMEKYSKLWKLSWQLFIPGKFDSIYGKNLRAAWNQFLNTIPLPEKLNEPVPFAAQREKSGYTALAAHSGGFVYYDFNRHAVYFTAADKSRIDSSVPATVKLFTADASLSHLSFSEDGTLLAVSDAVAASGKTMQKRTRIFDMKNRRFIGKPLASCMAACFIDDNTLCAVMLKNQTYSAVLLDRTTQEVKKVLYTAAPGQPFASLYSPCYIGKGRVAFIAANGVKRTIFCVDTETGALSAMPEQEAPYAIRYLQSIKSGDEYVLTFSWAEMDMLYRLGLYYPESGVLKTQQTDISGGVFFPVIVPNKKGIPENDSAHAVVYVGIHGTYHRLYTMDESGLVLKTVPLTGFSGINNAGTAEKTLAHTAAKQPKLELLNPERYRPDTWLRRIKVRPVFSIPHNYLRFGGYGFGLKLAMLDPTETIEISPSLMLFPKPFFMQGTLNTAFHFKPLSLHINGFEQLESKSFTYRKTGFEIGLNSSIPLSYLWENLNLSYQGTAAWIAPLSDNRNTYYSFPYRYTVLGHEGQMRYSNVRSSRVIVSPFFAKDMRGITAAASAAHAFCIEQNTHAAVFQAKFDGYLPVAPIRFTLSGYFGVRARLNPLNGSYSHIVAGFPVTATTYFPSFDAYNTGAMQRTPASTQNGNLSGGISGICDITVFSYELQTGGFFSPLFLNRIAFHTGYACVLTGDFGGKAGKKPPLYLDTAYVNCIVTFNSVAEVGLEYAHPLRYPMQRGAFRAIFDLNL